MFQVILPEKIYFMKSDDRECLTQDRQRPICALPYRNNLNTSAKMQYNLSALGAVHVVTA